MSASTRWLAGVAVVVAIAVVLGVAVAAFGGRAQTFAEGTPEHVVQQYLRAVSERDAAAAMSYLSSSLTARCEDLPRDPITRRQERGVRASLEETTVRDGTATVRVRLTETYGEPPFGGGESSYTQVFELQQEQGEWRFSESPWPLYCPPPTPR